ncbi:Mitochondrial ribosomal protein L43 [Fasciola hepatica]|uniref:Large ribosomal subunit protein mL43 n=1 Tax=Fasciola hepatica TaxID=6192 RepID=A0A4E0R4S3_FASHE|nr:Mitochondrial ribosomal protein L43 [Fasciola hepatica]
MSGNAIPRTLLQFVGSCGASRPVPQLQRVTLKFCKSKPQSLGIREYIEKYLVDFARRNPATVVYVKPRRHRPPLIVAEYLCGNWHYVKPAGMNCEEINNWMEFLRNRSGADILPIYKKWSTKSPSIQGMWHPFSEEFKNNTPLMSPEEILENLDRLSKCDCATESAEEKLTRIAHRQNLRL